MIAYLNAVLIGIVAAVWYGVIEPILPIIMMAAASIMAVVAWRIILKQ